MQPGINRNDARREPSGFCAESHAAAPVPGRWLLLLCVSEKSYTPAQLYYAMNAFRLASPPPPSGREAESTAFFRRALFSASASSEWKGSADAGAKTDRHRGCFPGAGLFFSGNHSCPDGNHTRWDRSDRWCEGAGRRRGGQNAAARRRAAGQSKGKGAAPSRRRSFWRYFTISTFSRSTITGMHR